MKKTGLLLLGLILTILTHEQTIRIQGGTSFSKLDWQQQGSSFSSIFNEPLVEYSLFAGIDYLDKPYFNLSSNVGMIRKGGKGEWDPFMVMKLVTITEKPTLTYLSINTTMDVKYRIKKKITPFISFGPRFDYLVNNSWHFNALKEIGVFKKNSIGLLLGGGVKYDVSSIQFGLLADYYLNFTKVAHWTSEYTGTGNKVTVNTFTINLTLGYKIK